MTPADLVIERWGGNAAELANDLGYSRGTPYQWQSRGGHIPSKAQQRILQIAPKKGIVITAEELVLGGKMG